MKAKIIKVVITAEELLDFQSRSIAEACVAYKLKTSGIPMRQNSILTGLDRGSLRWTRSEEDDSIIFEWISN